MANRVEEFVYTLLTDVFYATDSASIAIDMILKSGSYDPGPKAKRIEELSDWIPGEIMRKAALLNANKGPQGDFDD